LNDPVSGAEAAELLVHNFCYRRDQLHLTRLHKATRFRKAAIRATATTWSSQSGTTWS